MDKDIQSNRDKAAKEAAAYLANAKYDITSDEKKLSSVLKAAIKDFMDKVIDEWTIAEIGEQMEANPAVHNSDVQEAVYALADLGYALSNEGEKQRVGEIIQTLRSVLNK